MSVEETLREINRICQKEIDDPHNDFGDVGYAIERCQELALAALEAVGPKTNTTTRSIADLIRTKEEPPLPLSVIPNYMGINLCSVASMSWTKQDDEQLVSLTIQFVPAK